MPSQQPPTRWFRQVRAALAGLIAPNPPASGRDERAQNLSATQDAPRAGLAMPSDSESLPVPIIHAAFPPIMKELQGLRDSKVSDLMSHLLGNPQLAQLWLMQLRIVHANQAALQFAGCETVEQLSQVWTQGTREPFRQMFHDQLRGIWEGHRLIETEESFMDSQQQLRAYMMRASFSDDFRKVVIVLFDTTTAKRTVNRRTDDLDLMRDIIARANMLLWWAKVHRQGEHFRWRMNTPLQTMKAPIYRLATAVAVGGLWDMQQVPDAKEMDALSQKAMMEGWPGYHHEFRVIINDQVSWISEDVVIQRLSDNEWSLAAVAIDVTRIHEADAARRAAESQTHQLLLRADCLLWQAKVVDSSDGVLTWQMYLPPSAMYRRIFGHDPESNCTELWTDQDIPEMAEMNERATKAIRDQKPGYEHEFRLRQKGHVLWMHEQVSISQAEPGEWNLVGIITDVSARREAEHALAAEKERLTVTLRAMTEGVITVDFRGIVQFMNRAASLLSGRSASSSIGQPLAAVVSLVHAASSAPFAVPIDAVLRDAVLAELPEGLMLKTHADRTYMIEGCIAPVQDAGSRTIGAVLVMRDATERLRMEEHIQRATKMESVGLLAGGIAHDFNNILTAVLGNITLARADTAGMPDTDRCLEEAQRATNRARDLTLQLLTFSKGGDPICSALLLPQIITEAARFALHGSTVKEELELEENLWPVNADRGQLCQVIQNLVINAMQAMPGGGSVRIVARNQRAAIDNTEGLLPGDYVRVDVIDTGVGIKPEHISRVFDLYYTTRANGHGLGLPTVYSIIKKHQGHISLHSEEGKGSTFSFWLPALSESFASSPSKEPSPPLQLLKGKILFMDDEEPIITLASRMLKKMGLDLDAARNGKETVALYRKAWEAGEPYRLVLMDLTIPGGMGGRETLIQLKKINPDVKAIVSSGYSGDQVLANYKAHGFQAMIAKPYELQEVVQVLGDLLRSD